MLSIRAKPAGGAELVCTQKYLQDMALRGYEKLITSRAREASHYAEFMGCSTVSAGRLTTARSSQITIETATASAIAASQVLA
jgi:hypothetical protein